MKTGSIVKATTLLLGIFFYQAMSIAGQDESKYIKPVETVCTIDEKTQKIIFNNAENGVLFPGGILHTQGLLNQLDGKTPTKEISDFTGDSEIDKSASLINELKSMKMTNEESKKAKFILDNNTYAIFNNKLKLNEKIINRIKENKNQNAALFDLNNIDETVTYANNIAQKDSKGKIKEIIKKDDFKDDHVCLFLNTLNLEITWSNKFKFQNATLTFMNNKGEKNNVKAFSGKDVIADMATDKDGVNFIFIPMTNDTYFAIRHDGNGSVAPISKKVLKFFVKEHKSVEIKTLALPEISMETELDLKKSLSKEMNETMTGKFKTALIEGEIEYFPIIQGQVVHHNNTLKITN